MKLPSQLASDRTHTWLTITQAAAHFGRNRATIYDWCVSGFCLSARFKVFRDITGHYWIGIPVDQMVQSGL
jgi:hypothetical protein